MVRQALTWLTGSRDLRAHLVVESDRPPPKADFAVGGCHSVNGGCAVTATLQNFVVVSAFGQTCAHRFFCEQAERCVIRVTSKIRSLGCRTGLLPIAVMQFCCRRAATWHYIHVYPEQAEQTQDQSIADEQVSF